MLTNNKGGEPMRKSKKFIVLLLALILCFVCVTTSTFSWFTRPQTQRAEKFGWNINYDISQGNGISMKTYSGSLDQNGKVNYPTESTSYSDSSLSSGGYKYFRTDITNKGSASQSVSLFLTKVAKNGSSGKFFLGVNGPTRTYKEYFGPNIGADEKTTSAINQKNVYVGFNNNQTYVPTAYQVHFWGGTRDGDAGVKAYFNPNKTGNYADSTYNMTYATIDYDATSVKLRKSDTWYGVDNTDVDTNNTIIHWQKDASNYDSAYTKSGEAAAIKSYYSSAKTYLGSTQVLNLSATGTAGEGGVKYTSSNTAVATVDSKTGVVTRKGVGKTNIKVIATGAYGDTVEATCALEVLANPTAQSSAEDVPIVTNLKIEPAVDASNPTVVSVYWYIKNDGTGALNYTVEDIYMTL